MVIIHLLVNMSMSRPLPVREHLPTGWAPAPGQQRHLIHTRPLADGRLKFVSTPVPASVLADPVGFYPIFHAALEAAGEERAATLRVEEMSARWSIVDGVSLVTLVFI